jgi:hypothetical protein
LPSFSDEEKWRLDYISMLALSMTTVLVTKSLPEGPSVVISMPIYICPSP